MAQWIPSVKCKLDQSHTKEHQRSLLYIVELLAFTYSLCSSYRAV